MRVLNEMEVGQVSAGFKNHPDVFIMRTVGGIEWAIERLPIIYDKAINATSEMMCRATRKC
jgi:hypothetical protein